MCYDRGKSVYDWEHPMDKEDTSDIPWEEMWGMVQGHSKREEMNHWATFPLTPSKELKLEGPDLFESTFPKPDDPQRKHEVVFIGEKMNVKRPEDIDDLIVQHLANALFQINDLVAKRKTAKDPMNILERVGCFCTFLRTSLLSQEVSTDFYRMSRKLAQPKMWSDVGIPQFYRFEWSQFIETENGRWQMSRPRLMDLLTTAKELCNIKEQMGAIMPSQPILAQGPVTITEPDPIQKSFVEMRKMIAEAEETNKKARRLNYEADRVMTDLTIIAESLAPDRIPA